MQSKTGELMEKGKQFAFAFFRPGSDTPETAHWCEVVGEDSVRLLHCDYQDVEAGWAIKGRPGVFEVTAVNGRFLTLEIR